MYMYIALSFEAAVYFQCMHPLAFTVKYYTAMVLLTHCSCMAVWPGNEPIRILRKTKKGFHINVTYLDALHVFEVKVKNRKRIPISGPTETGRDY